MTSPRPSTLAECFVWLNHNLTHKQLADLESLAREDLWQAHFWLTPIIESQLIADNDALRQRLDQSAFCSDPDIASQIGDAFWDHLQIVKSQQKDNT